MELPPGATVVGSDTPSASGGYSCGAVEILSAGTIQDDPSAPPVANTDTVMAALREGREEVFRALAAQKACRIEEGHLMADHVHMLLSIPPRLILDSRVVMGQVERNSLFLQAFHESRGQCGIFGKSRFIASADVLCRAWKTPAQTVP
jgi:hypothetical protein